MTEQEFRQKADEALAALERALNSAADDFGFDVDANAGTLTVEFDDPPAKFVISPNTPPRQIWVSALSRSYKLDWDEVAASFVLVESGQTLKDLLESVIGKQLGEEVSL